MFNKLKQFNDLRKQANSLKSTLAVETVTIEQGGVKIILDGNQEVKSVSIEENYLDRQKKASLENDIREAMNKGVKQVQKIMVSKMKDMGGFNLPGMN